MKGHCEENSCFWGRKEARVQIPHSRMTAMGHSVRTVCGPVDPCKYRHVLSEGDDMQVY